MTGQSRLSSALSIDEENIKKIFIDLLNIPSPSFHEKQIYNHIKQQIQDSQQNIVLLSKGHSLIAMPNIYPSARKTRKHIVLVGHTDVVPKHFKAYQDKDRIHGAGASDMQASLSVFLYLLKEKLALVSEHYRLSFIFYSAEETANIEDNGLYQLIKVFPNFFKTIDLALVAEPTDNKIQLGCMGSLHAKIVFQGKPAHSARPWHGQNALYKALPFIQNMSLVKPEKYSYKNLSFYDVMSITESSSSSGKTTVPQTWSANVNFRFAPHYSRYQAEKAFLKKLEACGAAPENIEITSFSPAGKIIESPLLRQFLTTLDIPQEAKQAWTDIAQFSALGLPSFNYGPGIVAQCHTENEYAKLSDIMLYTKNLIRLLAK